MSSFLMLILLASPAHEHKYPLAAALVIGHEVVVVDVPTKSAKAIDIGNIVPEEADLSPDKALVAFNGYEADVGRSLIYLYHVGTGRIERVAPPGKGSVRFPRFSPTGEWLQFVAAELPGAGGDHNPGQVYRLRLKDEFVEKIETDPKLCHFSPVEVSPTTVAHVETPCMLSFDLRVTDTKTKTSRFVSNLSGPDAELATSLDRKTLLFTSQRPDGTGFYALRDGAKAPAFVAAVGIDSHRLQPRFVCPKDVVFYNKGKVWLLDSKSGAIEEIVTYPAAIPDGGLK